MPDTALKKPEGSVMALDVGVVVVDMELVMPQHNFMPPRLM